MKKPQPKAELILYSVVKNSNYQKIEVITYSNDAKLFVHNLLNNYGKINSSYGKDNDFVFDIDYCYCPLEVSKYLLHEAKEKNISYIDLGNRYIDGKFIQTFNF